MTPTGTVTAQQIAVGDEVIGLRIPGIPDNFREIVTGNLKDFEYSFTQEQLDNAEETVVTVVAKTLHDSPGAVVVNSDIYSTTHWIVTKRGEDITLINAVDIQEGDLVYNYATKDFAPVEIFSIDMNTWISVYSINVEPQDFYFTESGLAFDGYAFEGDVHPN
jgi:archaellum component FlaF (FlaF/FlaG flagellin family)